MPPASQLLDASLLHPPLVGHTVQVSGLPPDHDQYARAALPSYGRDPDAPLRLLSLSENATYRIDDPRDGRTAVLRVHRTGYHPPGAVASELAWLQALRRDEGLLTPAVFPATDGREVVDVTIGPAGLTPTCSAMIPPAVTT